MADVGQPWIVPIAALVSGIGGALITKLPDFFKVRGEASEKRKEEARAAAESMGLLAAKQIEMLLARIERLEASNERREADHKAELEKLRADHAADIAKMRHKINDLSQKLLSITFIADMEPGPQREKYMETMLRSFSSAGMTAE